MILISGPRQAGKTTLGRSLAEDVEYLNYDVTEDRPRFLSKKWRRDCDIVLFDEVHKLKDWRSYIKGIYYKEGTTPGLVVTGSVRLETYRKMGDSMAGRYFRFRLYPFDLKELVANGYEPEAACDTLLAVGGFPEPFLKEEKDYHRMWKRTHVDSMIRQDLRDISALRDLNAVELLIELLRDRVGSPVSVASLARDLNYSPKAVREWLALLEHIYVIFKVTPYHRNIARAISKEPKYYFYDTGVVRGHDGVRFENMVANALLKQCHFQEDTMGHEAGVYYVRNRQGKEVDFCVVVNGKVTLIETKWADENVSATLSYFGAYFDKATKLHRAPDHDAVCHA